MLRSKVESLIAQNADLIQERKKLQAETKDLGKQFKELEKLERTYAAKLSEAKRASKAKKGAGNQDRAIFAEG